MSLQMTNKISKPVSRIPLTIHKIKDKTQKMLKLMRYKNILPSILLSFSGGWILNHSITVLIKSPAFLTATVSTVSIMTSSMIINDIFDIEIDRINHPSRPLVNGDISKKEAILTTTILLSFTEFLSFKYLPYNLQLVIHAAILNIILYTPFLKKIIFIKNISCASLISFSSIFAGLASLYDNNVLPNKKNMDLITITGRFLFLGSFFNEMLLDMRDYEGDKQNNIHTIPVVFGKEFTWYLAFTILKINILNINSIQNC
jgi:4-hydroxybenzoate polyprenyltransferase